MCESLTTVGSYKLEESRGKCYILSNSKNGYYSITFPKGHYFIELWGSSAGTTTNKKQNAGGKGGYTSGELIFYSEKNLYFFIGTAGTDSSGKNPGIGGYNGGANGARDNTSNADCPSGGSGGATDIRYIAGTWNSAESLSSRIMVAGAGGSSGCYTKAGLGGHAGGLRGDNGGDNQAKTKLGGTGGSQTDGYKLGEGEKGIDGEESGGSGGAGYWGGKGGKASQEPNVGNSGSGGGGGSSYISGFNSCTKKKYIFLNAKMISGNQNMPSISSLSGYETTGHIGDGYARITYVSKYIFNNRQTCKSFNKSSYLAKLISIMILCKN